MKRKTLRLIDQLAARERDFVGHPFLAPAVGGVLVRVRLGGAICSMRIEPPDFVGWGVFEPVTWNEAIHVRDATVRERQQYLELLPSTRMIVAHRAESQCLGMVANRGMRPAHDRVVPVQLAEAVRPFDTIHVRHDGVQFWFDRPDLRADLAAADYLRESLTGLVEPAALERRGLTGQQRCVYTWLYQRRVPNPASLRRSESNRATNPVVRDESITRELVEQRLQDNLNHAGAQLLNYREWGDVYQVTYQAHGQRFTSAVQKSDLTIASAGICLDGEDAKFDLASLVGVLGEGRRRGEIYRM